MTVEQFIKRFSESITYDTFEQADLETGLKYGIELMGEALEWADGCGYSRIPYDNGYGEWAYANSEGYDIVAKNTPELIELFLQTKSYVFSSESKTK